MGTTNLLSSAESDMGIVSRAINQIFNIIEKSKEKVEYLVKVSYFEIYNDSIIDLLDPCYLTSAKINK